jgi:hypothetical protein
MTTKRNAPFNINNEDQRMQTSNPVEENNRPSQVSPIHHMEATQAVQTGAQVKSKDTISQVTVSLLLGFRV